MPTKNSTIILLIYLSILTNTISKAQEFRWEKVNFLIGDWVGNGVGIGIKSSEISASYNYCLNDHFIEITNHFERKTSNKKQLTEIRDDWGMLSYNNNIGTIVYRQFNADGSFVQYHLNDSLSTIDNLIFESEIVENYKVNAQLRFTIRKVSEIEITTYFDIMLPGKPYVCYEQNKLIKQDY
ncbi:MAG: hypothetical protein RBT49_08400 [Bacteroidales bacterium]|jgi:hypothetical protein|nr:hypothetical protein [Bacteroidales bacterium]